MPALRPLVLVIALAALAACQRAPTPAAAPATAATAAAPPASASAPAAATALPTPGLGSFRVVDVQLGAAVDASQQVTAAQDAFAPRDTIYASVLTSGTHEGLALSAKWTRADGTPIAVSQQALVPDAPLAVAFRIADPAVWPSGAYRVEIAANGQVLATRDFSVR